MLFNIYSEAVLKEALQELKGGRVIGGMKISNLHFAEDSTLCAKSETDMNQLLKYTEESSNTYRLTINRKKSKVRVKDRAGVLPPTTVLNNNQKVEEFVHLGLLGQAMAVHQERTGIVL